MTDTRVAVISPRQREIVGQLTTDGASNRQIGERLGLSENTVKSNMRDVLFATGCPTRTALVVALLRGQLKLRTTHHR